MASYLSCLLFFALLLEAPSTYATEELFEGSGEGSGEQPQQLAFTNIVDLVTATSEATTDQNPLTTTNEVEECLPKVDIVFVLDTSGNIEQIYKEHVKWTVQLVESLPVRKDAVRIAALQYAGSPITEFSLGTYSNGSEVSEHLRNIEFQSGVTRTGIALRKAEAELFREDKGARLDAAKIIILFTDGLSIDDPLKPAQQLRDDKKVKIYVVSVGSDGFEPEMNRIAGLKKNVYGPKDLEQLKESLHQDIDRAQNCPLTTTTTTVASVFANSADSESNTSNLSEASNATVVFSEGVQTEIQAPSETENNSTVNVQLSNDQQTGTLNTVVNQESVNASDKTAISEVAKETTVTETTPAQPIAAESENVPAQSTSESESVEPIASETILQQNVSSELGTEQVVPQEPRHGQSTSDTSSPEKVSADSSEKTTDAEKTPVVTGTSESEKKSKTEVSTASKTNETIPLKESLKLPKKQTTVSKPITSASGKFGNEKTSNTEVTVGKAEVVPDKSEITDKDGPIVVKVKVPVKSDGSVGETSAPKYKPQTAQQTSAKPSTPRKVVKDKTERPYAYNQQQYNAQYTTKTPAYLYESYTKKPTNPAEARRQTTRHPTTPKPNIRRTDGTCPVDILFVVDSSGSVKTIYEQQKQYIYDILEEAQVADHEHRTALIQFAGLNHQRIEWTFDTFEEKEDLLQAFSNVRHFTGTTFIGKALEAALKLLSTRRAYVPTLVILLSDGFSQDDATLPAGTIQRSPGVDFYAVSISDLSNTEYLETLTGDPGKVYIGEESEELKRYLVKLFRCEA
uniref:VWFA domain-containing protein n=1 Tax=Syphacia muris TaxID=451379 RepID=A0A0N5AF89_9BILA